MLVRKPSSTLFASPLCLVSAVIFANRTTTAFPQSDRNPSVALAANLPPAGIANRQKLLF